MTRNLIRTLAALGVAALFACSDTAPVAPMDGADAGDNGLDASTGASVALGQTGPVSVDAGSTETVLLQAVNPADAPLTWDATSATLPASVIALEGGDNAGTSLRLSPTSAELGQHVVTVSASWPGGVASADVAVTVTEAPCLYPSPTGFGAGEAFPDFAWTARYADGTEFTFDLYDFHCNDEAWGDYETLAFVVIADWCPNCPGYMRYVDALSERLEQEGMALIFVDGQDRNGRSAFTEPSNQHINRFTPNAAGIRVGDGDNSIRADGIVRSDLVDFFPTSWVVRRSDMQLIADQRTSDYYLPFAEIAMDPQADWSAPPAPTILPEFPSSCEDGDDEEYEPNNTTDSAPAFDGPISFSGGVCDSQPDFFEVAIEGDWTVTLEFDNDLGDLDVYVWDAERQRPALDESGSAIGSDSTNDIETFSHSGPATLFVYGYDGATAPYTFTLSTP